MKKIFLSTAFMLISGFSFANEMKNEEIVVDASEQDYHCMYLTNGCNQLVLVCWPDSRHPSTDDFADLDWSC
ncbi:hypothetical protein K5I29_08475 [Flavobacterium agricola]|uniref:Secreted protein n=1 Tax=Flavobacterium agricola TaxID=2870839 RepID=A0ABY6M128_9FLAO|nr:hypothetical protein [Flavobacterium agricola]UYW00578.1 hypothetical protein K5I29_08475 [Flavobacterium agricola]